MSAVVATSIRLLEADPDLAEGLGPEHAEVATRALVVPLVPLPWRAQREGWGPEDPAGYFGLLIVEGLLLREIELLGTHSAELLAHGDLLRPWDSDGEEEIPVRASVLWTALEPVAVAVLDADFVRRAASWPTVMAALARRAVIRAKFMALNDAITNVKRVDTRLLLLFWHLAERWGRVGVDAISIPLPLTHETLAKLVGAARPSVSTALGALAERRLLRREEGVWQLSRDAEKAFGSAFSPRQQPADELREAHRQGQ